MGPRRFEGLTPTTHSPSPRLLLRNRTPLHRIGLHWRHPRHRGRGTNNRTTRDNGSSPTTAAPAAVAIDWGRLLPLLVVLFPLFIVPLLLLLSSWPLSSCISDELDSCINDDDGLGEDCCWLCLSPLIRLSNSSKSLSLCATPLPPTTPPPPLSSTTNSPNSGNGLASGGTAPGSVVIALK